MVIQRDAAVAAFKVRAPGSRTTILLLVTGGGWAALTALNLTGNRPWPTLGFVAIGCLYLPLVWTLRTFGIDLTPESAIVRGFRRRRVPWRRVQAVVGRTNPNGTSAVWLALENGQSVTLPYPATLFRAENAQFENDFHRIDRWWLAHRGDSWRDLSRRTSGAR